MTKRFDRPGTPTSIQSSEDRDLAAIKKRKTPTHLEIDADEEMPDREDTKPTEMVSFRYDSDPAFRELWDRVTRLKQEDRRTMRGLGSTALEIHQEQRASTVDPDVTERITKIETSLGITKWLLGFVLATALGSIIVLATKIFTWGQSSGEMEMRVRTIERDVESVRSRVEKYMNRRGDSPAQPTNGDK